MTKKDYIKFAEMLKGYIQETNQGTTYSCHELGLINGVIRDTIKIFKEDNPRFNEDTFRKAIYKN